VSGGSARDSEYPGSADERGGIGLISDDGSRGGAGRLAVRRRRRERRPREDEAGQIITCFLGGTYTKRDLGGGPKRNLSRGVRQLLMRI